MKQIIGFNATGKHKFRQWYQEQTGWVITDEEIQEHFDTRIDMDNRFIIVLGDSETLSDEPEDFDIGECDVAWEEANNSEELGDHECDDCGETYDEDDLNEIEDYHQRVDAGGIVPSGECPDADCGALCYPRDALAKFRAGPMAAIKAGAPGGPQTLVDETGDGRDYELIKSAQSVWVIVDGVSIWIRRGEEKELVMVEAYRKGDEDGEPIWTKETWVA
jgi:hypothetical protein